MKAMYEVTSVSTRKENRRGRRTTSHFVGLTALDWDSLMPTLTDEDPAEGARWEAAYNELAARYDDAGVLLGEFGREVEIEVERPMEVGRLVEVSVTDVGSIDELRREIERMMQAEAA